MNTVIPNQYPSSFFPHNYLSGKVVRIFHIVECLFRTSYVESRSKTSYLSGNFVLFFSLECWPSFLGRWHYLAAVIELHILRVVGWAM